MNTLNGYSKSTLTDTHVLTAAGGAKPISDFAPAYNSDLILFTPTEPGWYKIAEIKGYCNLNLLITGIWVHGSPSSVIVNISTRHTKCTLTQMSGLVGGLCSSIKIAKDSEDSTTFNVLVYIPNQSGSIGSLYFLFTGTKTPNTTITTYLNISNADNTEYGYELILTLKDVSGIAVTSDNYYTVLSKVADSDKVDGLHVGHSNGYIASYTNFPLTKELKDQGYLSEDHSSDNLEEFLKAICKWSIDNYSGKDRITLMGVITPNSSGTCIMHLYSNNGKDSDSLLPRYCRGLYQNLNGNLYLFGTYNYTWSYSLYAKELTKYWANIPVSTTSSTTTSPTFATATATTSVTTPLVSSTGRLTLNATSVGLDLKFNNNTSKSVILNGSAFKPFDDANNQLTLGSTAAKWSTIYGYTGDFITKINTPRIDGYDTSGVYLVLKSAPTAVGSLGGAIGIGNAPNSYGMFLWGDGTGYGHIQVGRKDGTNTAYLLKLLEFGGNVNIGSPVVSPAKLNIKGNLFLDTGDATLKIYSGKTADAKDDGFISMQTCIDQLDGETHDYASKYPNREAILLQPRGGKVAIGTVPQGSAKLSVAGNISLYASSGDSPRLIFQRGTTTDGVYDWDLYVTGGTFKIRYNPGDATDPDNLKEKWTEVLSMYPSTISTPWSISATNGFVGDLTGTASKVTCTSSTGMIDRPIVGTNQLNLIYYSPNATVNWNTGSITITNTTGGKDTGVFVKGKNYSIKFAIGSADVNRGIYDTTKSTWILYKDAATTYIPSWINKGSSNLPVYFDDTGKPIPVASLAEAYLSWGGKSISGSLSPVDVATDGEWSANRLSFMPASTDKYVNYTPAGSTTSKSYHIVNKDIDIEYSTDGGTTWSDYGATDDAKRSLVTSGLGSTFYLGKNSTNQKATLDKLRITITAQIAITYFRLRKIYMYISQDGATNCTAKIEYSKAGIYPNTNWDNSLPTDGSCGTWETLGEYPISGWAGWNSIPFTTSFGGSISQTSNTRKIRITLSFATHSVSASNDYTNKTKFLLLKLYMMGDTLWAIGGGNLPKMGHIYSWDINKRVTFPSTVYFGGNSNIYYLGLTGNIVSNTLTAKGNALLESNLTVNGNTILGNAVTDTVTVKGPLTLENNITVAGLSTFNNNVSILGELTARNKLILTGGYQLSDYWYFLSNYYDSSLFSEDCTNIHEVEYTWLNLTTPPTYSVEPKSFKLKTLKYTVPTLATLTLSIRCVDLTYEFWIYDTYPHKLLPNDAYWPNLYRLIIAPSVHVTINGISHNILPSTNNFSYTNESLFDKNIEISIYVDFNGSYDGITGLSFDGNTAVELLEYLSILYNATFEGSVAIRRQYLGQNETYLTKLGFVFSNNEDIDSVTYSNSELFFIKRGDNCLEVSANDIKISNDSGLTWKSLFLT